MSWELRDAYNSIAPDYLSKKQPPWQEFLRFLDIINLHSAASVIDVGAGNGRNLHGIAADLHIAVDLSMDLLMGYAGPNDGQRIAGAFPHLPFRKSASSLLMTIAVIHHLPGDAAISGLREMRRIATNDAVALVSVWRRWRTGYKHKLIEAIRKGDPLDPLINHHRPWYNSEREVRAIRFYHYYTFKELYSQVNQAGFTIKISKYLGGKLDDANIFAMLHLKT